MSEINLDEPIDPKLFQLDSPDGPILKIEAGAHDFVSWPGADAETFIETSASSEDREARNIHAQNKFWSGFLTLMSGAVIIQSVSEINRTGNKWYALGILGGVAGIGFGLHLPKSRTTIQTQQEYRKLANSIRSMPRQINNR